MKKLVLVLAMVFILSIATVAFADSGKAGSKAKNISSVEIDGSKVTATASSLVEIADYDSNITTSVFVLSGKSSEGVEISIYTKKDKKEAFSQQGLVEKFTVGKSGYFAKKIDVNEGTTYILIVAKKDSDIQLSLLKVSYEKKESFLAKVEKAISNFISSFGK
ncbi:hypothetical protein [Caldicellulosiruptor acetigenus]|uniref:Uncharacterized protein n=1 Tax=Caldicellulosiruptor acetigenus 6A TaxID=632516 RepID=G2PXY4_9FIRM|nr:hypothetical protein [Caldicellulosiruptor acetigenus]AEM74851.1 hypothetical protein Calla_2319 [Caldicellulosiruptor acetigenus 6A]